MEIARNANSQARDCREQLSANANCREHHYVITGYAGADGRLLGMTDALM
jgi:hypothetical protein